MGTGFKDIALRGSSATNIQQTVDEERQGEIDDSPRGVVNASEAVVSYSSGLKSPTAGEPAPRPLDAETRPMETQHEKMQNANLIRHREEPLPQTSEYEIHLQIHESRNAHNTTQPAATGKAHCLAKKTQQLMGNEEVNDDRRQNTDEQAPTQTPPELSPSDTGEQAPTIPHTNATQTKLATMTAQKSFEDAANQWKHGGRTHIPRLNWKTQRKLQKGTKKASIKVVSLNIRGNGNTNPTHPNNKWNHVNQLMRQNKIAVLAVQETHLSEEKRSKTEKLFSSRLKIIASADPESPSSKRGVAFILNKHLINISNITSNEIAARRALLISIQLRQGETINILNIYAPNDPQENKDFWSEIKNHYTTNPNENKPDLMIGDFNMVEDTIDRRPMHEDPKATVDALDSLKTKLKIKDGWRETYPTDRTYTFFQAGTGSRSCIDRIYIKETLLETAQEWNILPSGIPNMDHQMISINIVSESAPLIGKGRWAITSHTISDKPLNKFIQEWGKAAMEKIEKITTRSVNTNPQIIWCKLKKEILEMARKCEKAAIPTIIKEMNSLEAEIHHLHNNPPADLREDQIMERSLFLQEKLSFLAEKRHRKTRRDVDTRNKIEGETICKYWTNLNKEKKPRDMIYALRKSEDPNHVPTPNTPVYEKDSFAMAELARNYHENLQFQEVDHNPDLREQKINEALSQINLEPTEEQKESLAEDIKESDIAEALRLLKNGSAAGIDGSSYELWKHINTHYIKETKADKPAFNICQMLKEVFMDIMNFSVSAETDFAQGWMCPLYKKNNKNLISNYWPITLLNTDYKLLTKILAMRLADVAPSIIHKDQAGFIKGRSITEHTKLIRMIIEYAEVTEKNGLIITLDQEKAYDKIDHEYLWRVLENFKIPTKYTNAIKSLYCFAETKVMINGYMSSNFKVTRGVRQRDPLSCLLFDLAIEPLAAALRNLNLEGMMISGTNEKLIAKLFADDTTVVLSENNDFANLQSILENWCIASKAKFNVNKTEVIPIGTETFRQNTIDTRKQKPHLTEISTPIRITPEKTAIRILGAWFRNRIDQGEPWAPILEKIDKALERWGRGHPTIEGRRLIVQMIVGGMTQYLTQVQGMPPEIEKRISKRIRKFMWDENSQSPVSEEHIQSPTDQGGRNVLNIKARNDAIAIMWLKAYLNFGPNHATWTYFADAIFTKKSPKFEGNIDSRVKRNVFLQSWKTSSENKSKLHKDLKQLLTIAKKYNVRPEGISFSREILGSMPIWYHREASPLLRRMNSGKTSNCLKEKHGIRTVEQMAECTQYLYNPTHWADWDKCECEACVKMDKDHGCEHPQKCFKKALRIMNTLPQKWDPCEESPEDHEKRPNFKENEDGWISFAPQLTTHGDLRNIFRVFTTGEINNNTPELEPVYEERSETTIATDRSCIYNGSDEARAGAGGFIGNDDPRNFARRVPKKSTQSNQTGEMVAVQYAANTHPKENNLAIITDSKYVINAITKNMKKHEDEGYLNSANATEIRETIANLRKRQSEIKIKWQKGHTGHTLNEGADKLAGEGALLPQTETNETTENDHSLQTLQVTGALLANITQATAYKGIRMAQVLKLKPRKRTEKNIKSAQKDAKNTFGITPTARSLWLNLRCKDFSRETRAFLWRTMHDAYMIGDHWNRPNMPDDLRERSQCNNCKTEESMEHILTKCNSPGQEIVWNLAKKLWLMQHEVWENPTLGSILACSVATFKGRNDKLQSGKARLYRILISESAHLIWKLRCERTIRNENNDFTPNAIKNKWIANINKKLTLDCLLSDKKRYRKKATSEKRVRETWEQILMNKDSLHDNWVREGGVLVGINPEQLRDGVG